MKLRTLLAAAAVTAIAAPAFATSPDTYVVNFRNNDAAESTILDSNIDAAIAMAGVNSEEVVIDTSTAAAWEKGAHEAFDRDIVSIFNKWVGLPGFAVIVDAHTKEVISCVNSKHTASEIASEVRTKTMMAQGRAYKSDASTSMKTTQCPPAHNTGH
jgi:hypothetical protein